MRALAVTSAKRSAALPEVPTMAEAGVKARNPRPCRAFSCRAERRRRSSTPQRRDREGDGDAGREGAIAQLGFDVVGRQPGEFSAYIKTEVEKWKRRDRDAKIRERSERTWALHRAHMRIVDIRETAIPLKSNLANSSFDFSEMTTSVVAVDHRRHARRQAGRGFAFNSTGRYACGAQMRARFIPRILAAEPDTLLDRPAKISIRRKSSPA